MTMDKSSSSVIWLMYSNIGIICMTNNQELEASGHRNIEIICMTNNQQLEAPSFPKFEFLTTLTFKIPFLFLVISI